MNREEFIKEYNVKESSCASCRTCNRKTIKSKTANCALILEKTGRQSAGFANMKCDSYRPIANCQWDSWS